MDLQDAKDLIEETPDMEERSQLLQDLMDENDEWAELVLNNDIQEEVRSIMGSYIGKNTKKGYQNMQLRFLLFLYGETAGPTKKLLVGDILKALDDCQSNLTNKKKKKQKQSIKDVGNRYLERMGKGYCPIKLEVLEAEVLLSFMLQWAM